MPTSRGFKRPAVVSSSAGIDVAQAITDGYRPLFLYRAGFGGVIDTTDNIVWPVLGEARGSESSGDTLFDFTYTFDPTAGMTAYLEFTGAGPFGSAGSEFIEVRDADGSTAFRFEVDTSPMNLEFVNNGSTSSDTASFSSGATEDATISAKSDTVTFYDDDTQQSAPSHTMASEALTKIDFNTIAVSQISDVEALLVVEGEHSPAVMRAIAGSA